MWRRGWDVEEMEGRVEDEAVEEEVGEEEEEEDVGRRNRQLSGCRIVIETSQCDTIK